MGNEYKGMGNICERDGTLIAVKVMGDGKGSAVLVFLFLRQSRTPEERCAVNE